MKIGDICRKPVVSIDAEDSIIAAARLMREHHVGDVVVTRDKHGSSLPAGIITDRDIVVSLAAHDVALDQVSVGEAMSTALIVAHEDDDLHQTIQNMRDNGIRRVPVIDQYDRLVGLLSFDDLVRHMAWEATQLQRLIEVEFSQERRRR